MGEQLPINDQEIIQNQIHSREQNHPSSTRSKAPGKPPPMEYSFNVGDLVYLWADPEKTHARDRYIVVGMTDGWCKIRKFTRSQLRAKVYDVKVSDCYPVAPTILLGPNPTPVRDMHNTNLSGEDEPQTSQVDPPSCINCPQLSPVLTHPVTNEKLPPTYCPPPPQVLSQPMEIKRSPARLINPEVSEQHWSGQC